jgi:hypothetical protein
MKTINVENLPEPVVRAMEAVVETLREQFHAEEKCSVDPAKVKAAILARRNASRALNQDWENVDRETWAESSNTRDWSAMPRNPIPRRGDVWLVSLDPTIGHEVRKTRPAVVVTSDIYRRLVKRPGRVSKDTLHGIDRSLKIVLNLL